MSRIPQVLSGLLAGDTKTETIFILGRKPATLKRRMFNNSFALYFQDLVAAGGPDLHYWLP
ncbi:MAG: hypothetical protein MRK00_06250 [Nitrosomonas sp.]|nr:hypothetical protein [Nitrosomonas sp.]